MIRLVIACGVIFSACVLAQSNAFGTISGIITDPDGGVVRGTLDVLILKALSWGPRHGYAVAEWIALATERELLVEEGPLYTALHRLEKKGWLSGEWGLSDNNRRAKFYVLSPSGRRQLRAEMTSWERYARAVSRALAITTAATA